jgi:hypothetical protein
MSFITPSAVASIARTVDGVKLEEQAAKVLAPDVEYRLREVVQVRLGAWMRVRGDPRALHGVAFGGDGLHHATPQTRPAGRPEVRPAQQARQADSR